MINEQFFDYLKLLRHKYAESHQYNLFTVLRSGSDEVRLHSRFLVDVLNPIGSHNFGNLFLSDFLQRHSIELTGNITVDYEYKNIDILIRSSSTAIIIENKIYAVDQEKQLERYYETMLSEGYKDIHIFYLTLNGKEPSPTSMGNLENRGIDVKCISYQDDIHDWLTRCTELALRNAPLREAFIQYTSLISTLTNQIENMEHLEKLKKFLLSDNNLQSIAELNQAYEEIVIDVQLAMWDIIGKKMTDQFGVLSANSIAHYRNPKACVKNYVQGKRNSRFIIQEVELKEHPSAYLFVEQDHHLYLGIYTKDKELPNLAHDYNEENNMVWKYTNKKINFKNLSNEDIHFLSNTDSLDLFAQDIIDDLVNIKNMIINAS
ncbi:PDDEXK-like family protein [Photobacterium leiognathi]|uniref:PDDEXK-like family protein n=1 Tax=Photobacterium leiognathi TaxID=553611 RepID=UPI000D167ED6|nr:PD-(D/E)XK nuclease family protein [Photobacterium leiognathi]PSW58677.1 hypothetical protein C0W50_03745 [Photobacterium leiognathi subsp. mandapamensis]